MNTSPPPHGSSRSLHTTALASAVAVVGLLSAGCSGFGGSDSGADDTGTSRIKVAMITHGAEGDEFWERVRRGAEAAAAKDNIELTYASDADPAGQAGLVRDAVGDRVDGIAVTLARPDAMKAAVTKAKAAGIPVVGLNSGITAWQSHGLLEYFGQDESVAGRALGDKLDDLKARHALCVVHERGNVALEARCAGMRKTFGGQTENLYVDGTNMDTLTSVVADKLRQDPGIDEVVLNGAQFALAAVDSVKESGSKAKIATFDLNKDIVKAVQDGKVQFAVDQQPYLQGYLAVDAIWLHKSNGNISGGGEAPVLTGPAFVTKQNVEKIAKFAENGTR
ncbi:substrate-binding domain-containing protein [Streptomyces spongiae]|uniref:Sugar ABC transporter substrate-binding protein n=1 Tax=Streptomyces spongiae TaxID=565072 RepID=A0A5N8XTI2_9ACTN|nr:substrate-binding domain-containing protein [Streptomyces spongiae]MPY62692.1 sugar ABC transporter substrate-binding protein [Streptomyces spongiae]